MGTLASIGLVILVCILLISLLVTVAKKLISWAFTIIGIVFQGIIRLVTLPFVWIGKALFGSAR